MNKLLAVFLLTVSTSGAFSSAVAAEKINVLLPQRNANEAIAPFIAAKYLGYLEKEGLEVDYILAAGSNEVAIQVATGNAPIGWASPAQAVIAMQEGAAAPLDLRYFSSVEYRNIWSLSVPADSAIQSVAELRGKRIGVTALGSAGMNYGKAYLRAAGLNPDRDVTFIPIGAGGQAIAAMKQKVVDAIVFWETANVTFELAGWPVRQLKIEDKLAKLPDVSLLATNDTIKKKPKLLAGFGRALSKGLDFCLANRVACVLMTWKVYPETKPAEGSAEQKMERGLKMASSWDFWIDPEVGDKRGVFIETRWKDLSDFLLQGGQIAKPIPTSRMFTSELVDQINDYDRAEIAKQAKAFDLKTLR
ncbi:ABC transporter substrate-binding protein [Tardiphaga sp. 866_E4_N2_1]|jgi:NitT/TauT family transport system substrate-binding protein|uniref:ABC transporter substrate-binding protein n=1 Tax=unclassified Tardiphaga TaxID=2631404 RepID=UPI000B6D5E8B|nr:ABC transporter substrate-binding protein [Tardiphaga sp. OK246]SNT53298.1 NitT/TauT family transport system substrate-binding protein [Tardiphaga sp. OK246]